MPSIEENRKVWQEVHDWSRRGEEWSDVWGGVEPQWRWTILPRIQRFLPAGRGLEIGSGFGRWSRRLRSWCRELVLIDLAPRCVDACRAEFAADRDVSCFVTDGTHLPELEPGSVDFVLSFDSLVHAELDVLAAYAGELARALSPQGAAVIHHSNMANVLADRPGSMNRHWRAESVSAEALARVAAESGLSCVRQEIVDWGGVDRSDCLSTLVRPGSKWDSTPLVVDNPHFMSEALSIGARTALYGAGDEPRDR